jgi:hypothetical protein
MKSITLILLLLLLITTSFKAKVIGNTWLIGIMVNDWIDFNDFIPAYLFTGLQEFREEKSAGEDLFLTPIWVLQTAQSPIYLRLAFIYSFYYIILFNSIS